MARYVMSRFYAAFFILIIFLSIQAQGADLKGSIFLGSPDDRNPIPLSEYKVYLFDSYSREWLKPELTNIQGEFSFLNIRDGNYLMVVYSSSSLWEQRVWKQSVTAPSTMQPIIIPSILSIVPHVGVSEGTGEFVTDRGREIERRHYSIWIDVPEAKKNKIIRVTYFFNHSSFDSYGREREGKDPEDGYKYTYHGWGCLNDVRIRVFLTDELIEGNFKMCQAIRSLP